MMFVILTHDNQSILSSFSEFLSFVTNSPVAEDTGVGGGVATPETLDLEKIRSKPVEFWAKSVKTFAKLLYVLLLLQKWHENIWAEMVLEVIWFAMKWNTVVFFGDHFRASLGKFVQNSFAPSKICLLLHLWLRKPSLGPLMWVCL